MTLTNTIAQEQVLFVVLVGIKMVLLVYFLVLTDSKVQEASIFLNLLLFDLTFLFEALFLIPGSLALLI